MSIALAVGDTISHDHKTGKLQFLQVTANLFQIEISSTATTFIPVWILRFEQKIARQTSWIIADSFSLKCDGILS